MPSLFLGFWSTRTFIRAHKGCKSFQINYMNTNDVKNFLYYSSLGFDERDNLNNFTDLTWTASKYFCACWTPFTCNKVVDDSIGALICVHSPGNVPHYGTRTGVLGDCQLLVRQAATLRYTHTVQCQFLCTYNHIRTYSKSFILTGGLRKTGSLSSMSNSATCRGCVVS